MDHHQSKKNKRRFKYSPPRSTAEEMNSFWKLAMETLSVLSSSMLRHDQLRNDPEVRYAFATILAVTAQSLGAEVTLKIKKKTRTA